MTPFFASILAATTQHDRHEAGSHGSQRTDREGLCQAYDAVRREGHEIAPLPEDVSCMPKGRGYVLTPTADVKLLQLANTTVATPDSQAYITSDRVVDLGEVR